MQLVDAHLFANYMVKNEDLEYDWRSAWENGVAPVSAAEEAFENDED